MLKPIENARLCIKRRDPNKSILDLHSCGLFSDDIEALKTELKELSGITEINLAGNNLSTSCIPHLVEAMPQLWGINVSDNHLNDAAIPELLKFKSLRKLYAAESGITEEGAKLLLEKCKCTIIDISGSDISRETKGKLRALMKFNSQQALKHQMNVKDEEMAGEREKFIAENWEKHVPLPPDPINVALSGTYKVWTPEAIAELHLQYGSTPPPYCVQHKPKKALTLEQKALINAQKVTQLKELESEPSPLGEPAANLETKTSPK